MSKAKAVLEKLQVKEALAPGKIEFRLKEGLFITTGDGKVSLTVDIPRSALAGMADTVGKGIGPTTWPMEYTLK